MITASLLVFSLIIEYMYDPIIEKPSERIIKKTFILFKDSLNSIFDKFYIYLLFPIFTYIVITIVVSILGNLLHPFFSFLINLFILFYCLKPSEFTLNMEKIKNDKFLDNCKEDKVFIRMMSTKKYDMDSIKNNLFYNSLRNIFSVIFYFLLLGPAGSLAYLILDSYVNDPSFKVDVKSKNKLSIILGVLEYVPAHLTILSYAIVSDFEICVKSFKTTEYKPDLYVYNKGLVNNVGINLISESDSDNEIIQYKNIISRALLAWLSIVALLIFSGVFV